MQRNLAARTEQRQRDLLEYYKKALSQQAYDQARSELDGLDGRDRRSTARDARKDRDPRAVRARGAAPRERGRLGHAQHAAHAPGHQPDEDRLRATRSRLCGPGAPRPAVHVRAGRARRPLRGQRRGGGRDRRAEPQPGGARAHTTRPARCCRVRSCRSSCRSRAAEGILGPPRRSCRPPPASPSTWSAMGRPSSARCRSACARARRSRCCAASRSATPSSRATCCACGPARVDRGADGGHSVNLSEVSIHRPVLAIVCSLVLLVFGAVSFYFLLGVREFPSVDPPISPFAPTTRRQRRHDQPQITEPLEQLINGIDGIRVLSSVSRERAQSHPRRVPARHRPRGGRQRRARPASRAPPPAAPRRRLRRSWTRPTPTAHRRLYVRQRRAPCSSLAPTPTRFRERLQTMPGRRRTCASSASKRYAMRLGWTRCGSPRTAHAARRAAALPRRTSTCRPAASRARASSSALRTAGRLTTPRSSTRWSSRRRAGRRSAPRRRPRRARRGEPAHRQQLELDADDQPGRDRRSPAPTPSPSPTSSTGGSTEIRATAPRHQDRGGYDITQLRAPLDPRGRGDDAASRSCWWCSSSSRSCATGAPR